MWLLILLAASVPLSAHASDLPEQQHALRQPQIHSGRHALMSTSLDVDKRMRSQWQELAAICPNRNFTSCENITRSVWSDVQRTKISPLTFNGLGAWSTFKVSTFDKGGERRARGGDSWFLLLRDYQQRLRLPIRIFDDGNGTYTGAVHFLHPGNYTLFGWLYYSDCHGLQVGPDMISRLVYSDQAFQTLAKCISGRTFFLDIPTPPFLLIHGRTPM